MKRIVVLALTLFACTVAGPAVRAADAGKITCTQGADCDAKWRRALRWIMDNSVFPITEQSDNVISTTTRLGFGDTDLIFTITKAPVAYGNSGNFQFEFKAGCGTFFSGCRPTIQEAEASFVRFVSSGTAIPGAIVQPAPAVAPGAAPVASGAPPVASDAGSKIGRAHV